MPHKVAPSSAVKESKAVGISYLICALFDITSHHQQKQLIRRMSAVFSSSKLLFILPLITCLAFPFTFAITFGVYVATKENATANGDFPYISETGTKPPESCIFGQLLNIAAVISGLTIYIRYRQTREAFDHFLPASRSNILNFITFIIGMFAAFGVSMVGNFQMDNIVIAHFIGAALAFVLGAVYAWLQVIISYKLLMFMTSRPLFYFRVVCSLIVSIFLIGTVIGAMMYRVHPDNLSFRLWSTISEWIMAFGLALIFASFASEFRATKIEKPRISIIQEKLQKV